MFPSQLQTFVRARSSCCWHPPSLHHFPFLLEHPVYWPTRCRGTLGNHVASGSGTWGSAPCKKSEQKLNDSDKHSVKWLRREGTHPRFPTWCTSQEGVEKMINGIVMVISMILDFGEKVHLVGTMVSTNGTSVFQIDERWPHTHLHANKYTVEQQDFPDPAWKSWYYRMNMNNPNEFFLTVICTFITWSNPWSQVDQQQEQFCPSGWSNIQTFLWYCHTQSQQSSSNVTTAMRKQHTV